MDEITAKRAREYMTKLMAYDEGAPVSLGKARTKIVTFQVDLALNNEIDRLRSLLSEAIEALREAGIPADEFDKRLKEI